MLSPDAVWQGPRHPPPFWTDLGISELPCNSMCLHSSHIAELTSNFNQDLYRNVALNRHLEEVNNVGFGAPPLG